MRVLGLILYSFFIMNSVHCTEVDTFVYESKSYFFKAELSEKEIKIDWKKSGFKKSFSGKLSSCYKKQVSREIASLRKKFFSVRGRHDYGKKVEISWNSEKASRTFFPRELDRFDKRFSYLFNISQYGESKCSR